MAESTVHVVDDDQSFLTAMARLLRASGFAARTHSSAREFLEQRCDDEPGCVVVDLRMPDLGGLELQAALARTQYPLPVLFLTGHADTASTVQAMRGGAEDFLEKTAAKEVLLDAVRRALVRDQQERQARVHRDELRARFAAISAREREVLGHVLRGRLNKQIAGDLGIHERTVKVHRKAIMTKLSVRSVAALAQLSQEAGLTTAP
ncbi:MAG TPA: response regulator [Caldimonas sp.]|nr:response regulator [Caldimonas sp.]